MLRYVLLRGYMKILLFIIIILTRASNSYAERYAIIGPDNIVITVIESENYPESPPPLGGYIVLSPQNSGAESGGKYENGVFSRRPPTPQEILTQKMNTAIDNNNSFLSTSTPTTEQSIEQVKTLTKQVNAILMYQLQRFEGLSITP